MNLPKHVAFIVDGNRRWAKKRGLPQIAGHRKAANEIMDQLIYHCLKLKIPYVTFWVWSTENWKRGQRFAQMIFNILKIGLKRNAQKYIEDGIKLNTIGDPRRLPKDLVKEINNLKEKTKYNKKLTVTFAIDYGGRDEIIRAINKLKAQMSKLKTTTQNLKLTQQEFSQYLDTAGLPDPDLIIRTGGAQRLSGFMPWQSEYTEFYFTKTYFPDFTAEKFDKALQNFNKRKRNFGK